MLNVACIMVLLFAGCCLLFVCSLSFVVVGLLCVECRLLFVVVGCCSLVVAVVWCVVFVV